MLPTHEEYVGGDYYFDKSTDEESPAYYFYREVPVEEREALKKEDRRRLKIENVLGEARAGVLRDAMLGFVVGGGIRRLQAKAARQRPEKYSFLFHTKRARTRTSGRSGSRPRSREAPSSTRLRDETPVFNELVTHRLPRPSSVA